MNRTILAVVLGMLMSSFMYGQQLKQLFPFRDGKAVVQADSGWFIIDAKGTVLLDMNTIPGTPVWSSWGFSEGLMAVQYKNGKIGFVDITGRVIIKPQFDRASLFSNGLAAVGLPDPVNPQAFLWGYIDRKGNIVIRPQFTIANQFFDDRAVVRVSSMQWSLIDKQGKQVSSMVFSALGGISEGKVAARQNTTWGYIGMDGDWLLQPQWNPAFDFSEGLAAVGYEKGWGFINENGTIVTGAVTKMLPTGYVMYFKEGFAAVPVQQDGGWVYGFINRDGYWVIPPEFLGAGFFSGGVASVVTQMRQAAVVNAQNEFVIEPGRFDFIDTFHEGIAIARKGDRIGYINTGGEWLFETLKK